jgi:hypothetical protein
MVGIRHRDVSEDDVPECHVIIVTMVNQASDNLEDANKGLRDGDPTSKAGPEVGI